MIATYGVFELIRLLKSTQVKQKIVVAGLLALSLVGLNAGGEVDSEINRSQFQMIMGYVCFQDLDYVDAATHLEQALDISPDNVMAYSFLSTTYTNLQRQDDAANTLRRGLKRFPTYSVFNYDLGLLYAQKMEVDSAKTCFKKTIELAPQFALPYLRLGEIYTFEHKPDSSTIMYRLLLQVDPSNVEARARLQI
jgi:Tfp pilus assembly protein PilF